MRSFDICVEAVKHHPYALLRLVSNPIVEEKVQDSIPMLCEIAVKHQGEAVRFVPINLLTPNMCMDAVKQNGLVLRDIPSRLKTDNVCMEAIKQNISAFDSVPENMYTYEMCVEVVKKGGLKRLPIWIRSAELCRIAVQHHGLSLQFVPPHLLTPELCKIAVEQDKRAIGYTLV